MQNHIYLLDTKLLENDRIFQEWYAQMDPDRKKKIDSFRFLKDKRLCLAAGILLKQGLKKEGIHEYSVGYGDQGKPYLNGLDIYFNLSHSGNLAACAFSDRNVGVDVEAVSHFDQKLREYVFLPDEIQEVCKSAEESTRDVAFTSLWTVKESIMKYYGTGILLPPKDIRIFQGDKVIAECKEQAAGKLEFTRYPLDGYALCVCSAYPDFAAKPEWEILEKE